MWTSSSRNIFYLCRFEGIISFYYLQDTRQQKLTVSAYLKMVRPIWAFNGENVSILEVERMWQLSCIFLRFVQIFSHILSTFSSFTSNLWQKIFNLGHCMCVWCFNSMELFLRKNEFFCRFLITRMLVFIVFFSITRGKTAERCSGWKILVKTCLLMITKVGFKI